MKKLLLVLLATVLVLAGCTGNGSSSGDKDKAELIGKMAAAAKQAFDTGAGMLFDGNEYRKAMGYEEQAMMPPQLPPEPDPLAPAVP